MNGTTPPKKVISKIEKKMDKQHQETLTGLNRLADFVNTKLDSTTGQLYFKHDLLTQEVVKLKNIIEGLGIQLTHGFKILSDDVKELKELMTKK